MEVIGMQNGSVLNVDLEGEMQKSFETQWELEARQRVMEISQATSRIVFAALSIVGKPDEMERAIAITESLDKEGVTDADGVFILFPEDAVRIFRENLTGELTSNMDCLQEHFL